MGVGGIDNDQECAFMGNRIPLPHRSGVGANASADAGFRLANSSSLLAGVALGFSEASLHVFANPGKLR